MKFYIIIIQCFFLFFSVNICYSSSLFLTLEKAIDLALSQNRSLVSSANLIESSKLSVEDVRSAFNMKLTPTASAGITNGDSDIGAGIKLSRRLIYGPVLSLTPGLGRTGDDYSGSLALGLTIPLMRGIGKEINLTAVKSSEFNLRTSTRNDYISKVNTILTTVSYIYTILELKDLASLYRSQIITMQEYAFGSKVKKAVGLATPMDVFRAEILLKDIEDILASTLNLLSENKENLKRLLSLKPEIKIEVSAPKTFSPVDISLKQAIETAMAKRIEIEHTMDALRERIRESGVAENNLLPRLDLVIDYERYNTSDNIDQIMDMSQDNFSVNLVSTTDWTRTSEKVSYRKSLINIKNAKLDITSKKDEIVSEVKQYFRALEQNLKRIKIREEQIQKAKGKLKLSIIQYKYEMADNFDVIESEREIQQAKANLLAVQTDYIVGLYRFRAAMGTLIERE